MTDDQSCGTCDHWEPPRSLATLVEHLDEVDYPAVDDLPEALWYEARWGLCRRITTPDGTRDREVLAMALDPGDRAEVRTAPAFGCRCWMSKTP